MKLLDGKKAIQIKDSLVNILKLGNCGGER
jgi:hypothetical protein